MFSLNRLLLRLIQLSLLIVFAGSVGVVVWANRSLNIPGDELDFRVLPGSSVRQAIQQMNQAGLAIQPELALLGIRGLGIGNRLKAGTYCVKQGATPLDVLDMLKNGEICLVEIRFPEGWNLRQWLAHLQSAPGIVHELGAETRPEIIAHRLGLREPSPEGLFFPDTYRVDKLSSDLELLQKAYRSQQEKLAVAWKNRPSGLPYHTMYEALIMASIIEKETGRAEDRRRVAAVFVNRLRSGMRLQTDPTVIYGLGEGFDGNLRKADLLADTPYNTYTRAGLPPGPIAMPGQASIEAALHPADEDVYYFVARGDGSSQFSRTLAEHNAAVAQYQLKH